MKPLELHIYEKHPDADAYRVNGFYSPYCLVSEDKRFQPGELAAEYWRSNALGWMHEDAGEITAADRDQAQAATWHKFATTPHFDEADQ